MTFLYKVQEKYNAHTQLWQNNTALKFYKKKVQQQKQVLSFFDEDDKPVTNSEYGPGTDDVASAEVVRVWCDDSNFIYADLYFYYLQEWSNSVLITNDREFDWITLLDYLNNI